MLTVAAISPPQGVAYTLMAGLVPRFGFNSAIVVMAVASIFSSSSHLINGPTSAVLLLVFRVHSHEDFISGMRRSRRSPRAARRQSEN